MCKPVNTSAERALSAMNMSEVNHSTNEQECSRPVPTISYDATHNLCEECAQIDFDAVFDLPSEWDSDRWSKPISRLRTSFLDQCGLCDMAKTCLQRQYYPKQRNGRTPFHFRVCYDRSEGFEDEIYVAVTEGSRPLYSPLKLHVDESARGGVIVHTGTSSTAEASRCLGGRKLSQMCINYDEVRSWLQGSRFRSYQNVSSLTQAVDTFERYVIDCETRRIIVLQENMEYFALSYVWGHWHGSELSSEACNGYSLDDSRNLPSKLPQTVEDALSVVKNLHGRYLWVDRYCIPSWTDKHVQIQNMDQIYLCATATIVAIDPDPDTSSNSGLYGVSRARVPPRVLQVGHHELLLTAPHLSHPLAKSIWVTRGWTFQEVRLSRRCLFFTEDQVYYYCGGEISSEDTIRGVSKHRDVRPALVSAILRPRLPRDEVEVENESAEMLADIEEYTSRTLTYDADILDAFHGILRSTTLPTLWGVPLKDRGAHVWFGALLWFGQKQDDDTTWSDCLRTGYPTWSWLSRRGHIKFHQWAYLADRPERGAEISISKENGLIGLPEFSASAQDQGPGHEDPSQMVYKGLVLECNSVGNMQWPENGFRNTVSSQALLQGPRPDTGSHPFVAAALAIAAGDMASNQDIDASVDGA
ncbi:hypothetical protein H2204_010651 [Knufia peltigerae]|uniref:Heterokaryon incompatibility domain-containing protein n=1 Tax=Knufia peltigerae TaxID=1002370 RepID=A0AA39CUR5_9EURO|nr:hypothetical protein H2204_010651 [Knufia peltigerae]